MKKKNLKMNLIAISLTAIIFVGCDGGGGGGGGSSPSNLPIRPDHNNSIIRDNIKKDDTNKKENEKKINTQNTPKEVKNLEKVGKTSTGIAIMDSNFLLEQDTLKEKYPGIIILPSTKSEEQQLTSSNLKGFEHGKEILSLIKDQSKVNEGEGSDEAGTNLKAIVASVGIKGEVKDENGKNVDGVLISISSKDYDDAFAKFGNQKVKVFNQSLGDEKDYDDNYWKSYSPLNRTFSDNKNELEYFKEKIENNNGGLFVWAAGNHADSDKSKDQVAGIESAFPNYLNDLEKGWISVVGVNGKERIVTGENSTEPGNKYNILGSGKEKLSIAGEKTKWWTISARDIFVIKTEKDGTSYKFGSSYAAPRVSKAAALVAEKFPWMTTDQVRQTLFTTTDKMELTEDPKSLSEDKRRNKIGTPDTRYGWGMLNQDRALKGPGAFIKTNNFSENKDFIANIPDGVTSTFENDIWGNGSLGKTGKGTLVLKGNNTYEGGSLVNGGELDVYKLHSGPIIVGEADNDHGTLGLYSGATIGNGSGLALDIQPNGTLKINGKGITVKGDVSLNGTVEGDLNSQVNAKGTTKGNPNVKLASNDYVSKISNKVVLLSANSVEGTVTSTEINGMRKAEAKFDGGDLVANVSRMSASEYVGENADESIKNVAESIDKVFDDLDKDLNSGKVSDKKLMAASTLQSMSASQFNEASQLMSGEIYASAQALTFAQSQNINRDLSNRLNGLDNLKLAEGETQAWFSAIGTDGRLKQNGYASAKTHTYGGQFGVDKKFTPTTDLGIALAYSTANADFDKYAGKSKSNMVGLSLYGKQDLPYNFYTAGRLGFSHISTKVERELLTANADTVKGKINHRDKMLSAYIELGKKIGWLTPFIGYSQDYLRRGSFNESNAEWGIKADAKNYSTSNFLVGLKAEYQIDRYKLNAYITQARNVNGRDLSYEGTYSGNDIKQKFYGVKQAKNTTWAGVGAFGQITPVVGVYGNVDFRFQDGHRADSVFSTGLQYKF